MTAGRPSKFTQTVANEILNRLSAGESLRKICSEESMPSFQTVHTWLNSNTEFLDQYQRAREIQADVRADEVYDLPFDCEKSGLEASYTKLKMDGAKWAASKGNPKKYGDTTTLKGDKDNPLFPLATLLDERISKRETK